MKLLLYLYTLKVKVAMALSDLVIYTKAEKFRNFSYSREYQQFYESNSIEESTARKLSKLRGKFLWFKEMKCLNVVIVTAKVSRWVNGISKNYILIKFQHI